LTSVLLVEQAAFYQYIQYTFFKESELEILVHQSLNSIYVYNTCSS